MGRWRRWRWLLGVDDGCLLRAGQTARLVWPERPSPLYWLDIKRSTAGGAIYLSHHFSVGAGGSSGPEVTIRQHGATLSRGSGGGGQLPTFRQKNDRWSAQRTKILNTLNLAPTPTTRSRTTIHPRTRGVSTDLSTKQCQHRVFLTGDAKIRHFLTIFADGGPQSGICDISINLWLLIDHLGFGSFHVIFTSKSSTYPSLSSFSSGAFLWEFFCLLRARLLTLLFLWKKKKILQHKKTVIIFYIYYLLTLLSQAEHQY